MLKIRDEQMAAIEQHARGQMVKRLAEKLRGRCSMRVAASTPEAFEELVGAGVEQGEGYRIDEEPDLERFLLYVLGDGSSFETDEQDPEVQEILNDPDTDGDDKLAELDDYYADREGA